jgi:3-oxoacyl-[acyl-carrier protein] reductase
MSHTPSTSVPLFPDLAGKIAVVTGGSKGIGSAMCDALAANKARIAVIARDADRVADVVNRLSSYSEAIAVTADCTNGSALTAARREVEAQLGPADILIAFAGGFSRTTPILELEEEEWLQVVEANLTATFLTVKEFLPGMVERQAGAIVTMASNAGRLLDIPLNASYAASKAGVVMFTRHLALEVGKYGVRANCVAPATTLTERVRDLMSDDRRAEIAALAPLATLGAPEDSAYAALFLCSDAAKWITGITVDVSGGRIMI